MRLIARSLTYLGAKTSPCDVTHQTPTLPLPLPLTLTLTLALTRCTFTKYRYKANVGLVAHTCPVGEYNEMATLLFSSQEGIVELLFSRYEPTLTLTLP